MNACRLDVALIGRDTAAKVLVVAPAPVAEGESDQTVQHLHLRSLGQRAIRGAGPVPHSNAFERFALGLQIGLGIVVGGVEADVPEPASDHCDVHAGRPRPDVRQSHAGRCEA